MQTQLQYHYIIPEA